MRYRTLTQNKEFSRIYARGKSYVHPNLVLYVAKNRLGYTRIGLTATKKVGHAVQRNRARRIMRAALSEHLSQNIGGYDIILVARARTPYLKSTQLSKTLERGCRIPGPRWCRRCRSSPRPNRSRTVHRSDQPGADCPGARLPEDH